MDFALTKPQADLQQEMAAFARAELNQNILQRDRDLVFGHEEWKKCAKKGVLGWPVPTRYGGSGYDLTTTVAALEGLGEGLEDNALAFSMGAQMWSIQMPLLSFGNDQQREQFLPALISGREIGAHAISETGAGSDMNHMSSTAVRDGSNYVLNGHKTWITNAPIADLFLVTATHDPSLGGKALSTFLIKRNHPGLTVSEPKEKLGMKTAMMGEVRLQNCVVPETARLGKENAGSAIFSSSMEWERAFILAPVLGSMRRILNQCIDYSKTRIQFGTPIGQNQSISNKIAAMHLRLETSRLLIYRCAWMRDAGKRMLHQPSETKLHVSESWVSNCEDAVQIHGASGYMVENNFERHLRDAIGSRIFSGTTEIQKLIIARYLGL